MKPIKFRISSTLTIIIAMNTHAHTHAKETNKQKNWIVSHNTCLLIWARHIKCYYLSRNSFPANGWGIVLRDEDKRRLLSRLKETRTNHISNNSCRKRISQILNAKLSLTSNFCVLLRFWYFLFHLYFHLLFSTRVSTF